MTSVGCCSSSVRLLASFYRHQNRRHVANSLVTEWSYTLVASPVGYAGTYHGGDPPRHPVVRLSSKSLLRAVYAAWWPRLFLHMQLAWPTHGSDMTTVANYICVLAHSIYPPGKPLVSFRLSCQGNPSASPRSFSRCAGNPAKDPRARFNLCGSSGSSSYT